MQRSLRKKVAEEEKEDSDANGHGDISNAFGSEVAKNGQQAAVAAQRAAGDAEADEHEGGRGLRRNCESGYLTCVLGSPT